MKGVSSFIKQFFASYHIVRHILLAVPLSLVTGCLVAFFLWLLDVATHYRWQHEWLLYLLPVAGVFIYFLYKLWGKNSEAGNNLIMEEIHEPGGGVPARMAPLVLFSTVITHLFGGSAGREGTAVQMGGSIASFYGRLFKLSAEDVKVLLMCGIAAGFGAVFGTPVAGAIFALEVIVVGSIRRIRYSALLPCIVASFLAHLTTIICGIHHTQYIQLPVLAEVKISLFHIDLLILLKAAIAGVLFGMAAWCFSELSHTIKHVSKRLIKKEYLISVVGAAIVIAGCYLLGTRDYLGLGVVSKDPNGISIVNAFHTGGVTYWSWFWKLLFTVITLSTGFKGGEVTPLFFIGAALGNTLALLLGGPVALFAAIGFIAVFAGATNTPLACTLMGMELFGPHAFIYFAVACFTAYYFSGQTGIYTAQRLSSSKIIGDTTNSNTLEELRQQRISRHRNFIMVLLKKWRKQ